ATERPQRVLQALGQRHEALASEHNVSMLEAGEREAEVIETMIERLTGDGDAERARVGEVGQTQPPRLVLLAEDHVLRWPVERTPGCDAPLERAADVGVETGMAPAQLGQHTDRADAGSSLQHRHDLALPIGRQGIGSATAAWLLPLRRQPWIILDPVGG